MASTLFFLLLCTPSLTFALNVRQQLPPHFFWRRSSRNVPPNGYYDPKANGGSMLTQIPVTYPAGLGEPINVIISGSSDVDVLQDSETNGGMRNYFLSFGFSSECLGQHAGSDQAANLGDGNGYKNESAVIRWNYKDPELGACKETIQGGNHFRYWVQNGPNGNSGSIFMAGSYEFPIAQQHNIIPNGYNLGRDWLIGNITGSAVPTNTLTNATVYSGSTSYGGYTYQSGIQYVGGLMSNTSEGINHYLSVGVNGINAVDGLVAVLDVKITTRPAGASTSTGWRPTPLHTWHIRVVLVLLTIIPALPCI